MFFESDSVTQTTSYKYDNPNHMYLTEQTVYANSSPVITTYKYPQDIVFSNAPEEEGRVGLVDNNILSPLLESEKKTNNKGWISKTKYMYKDENRVPKAVSFAEGISLQNLHTKVSVQKFDKKGNPVFYINADMKNTVYIWGYGGHRLVAEIQNATYYDVIGFLGQERIDRLLSSPLPAQSDFDALEALRTQLPKAMVTTIHYQSPILGISSIKSPDEKVTRYEYDGCGRLKETYFFENNDPTRKRVVESYNYNYKNK